MNPSECLKQNDNEDSENCTVLLFNCATHLSIDHIFTKLLLFIFLVILLVKTYFCIPVLDGDIGKVQKVQQDIICTPATELHSVYNIFML